MTVLLLDHPWPLDAALDPSSEGFWVLLRFSDLVARRQLRPVPFVEPKHFAEVWSRIDYRHSGIAAFMRAVNSYVRYDGGGNLATPVPEPPGLTDSWKQALRESMDDLNDWRAPQIVVAHSRYASWGGTQEVAIQCADHGDLNYHRVLAVLDSYEAHPMAIADLDPWDVQRTSVAAPEALRSYPCRLPRHPDLTEVALDNLQTALVRIRARGWEFSTVNAASRQTVFRYCFIPPENWNVDEVEKQEWRDGRAFPRKLAQHRNQVGYLDFEGRLWVWDRNERHWDVQNVDGTYVRISHTGDRL
jgi:hypothetical protein